MSDDEIPTRNEPKEPPDHQWLEQESIRKDWSRPGEDSEGDGE
jgi:hypothetical protein